MLKVEVCTKFISYLKPEDVNETKILYLLVRS